MECPPFRATRSLSDHAFGAYTLGGPHLRAPEWRMLALEKTNAYSCCGACPFVQTLHRGGFEAVLGLRPVVVRRVRASQ